MHPLPNTPPPRRPGRTNINSELTKAETKTIEHRKGTLATGHGDTGQVEGTTGIKEKGMLFFSIGALSTVAFSSIKSLLSSTL